jgi:hypothetical protein
LTIQSIIQALSNKEETVKDSITTYEKVPILVHELILVELWREKVFPKLLNSLKTSKVRIFSNPFPSHHNNKFMFSEDSRGLYPLPHFVP